MTMNRMEQVRSEPAYTTARPKLKLDKQALMDPPSPSKIASLTELVGKFTV